MAIKKLSQKNEPAVKKNVFKQDLQPREENEQLFSDAVVKLYKGKNQVNNGKNTRRQG